MISLGSTRRPQRAACPARRSAEGLYLVRVDY